MTEVSRRYLDLVPELLSAASRILGDRLLAMAVFGSVGRGTAGPHSDMDVLLVVRGLPPRARERLEPARALARDMAASGSFLDMEQSGLYPVVSVVALSEADLERTPPILLDLAEDAVIVHDNGSLAHTLDALRARLKQLGSRRVWFEDGSWYWDLKPDLRPGEVFTI